MLRNRFQSTGHVQDDTTGLTYMQARYYDPAIGRFLSKDPVGFAEGGVGYFNRYSYVMNDPVNMVDPDGRFAAAVARIGIRLAAPRIVARLATAEGAQATANLAGVTTLLAGAGDPVETIKGLAQIADGIVASDNQQEVDLPETLVGDDQRAGGGRTNSGPLSPDHGGTGDAAKDFDILTGGNSQPAAPDRGAPDGTLVGDNGIQIRPGTDDKGPRIDIPANGNKPPETLHYPK